MRKLIYYSICFVVFSCSSNNIEKALYNDGSVKYQVNLVDGLRQGMLEKYYPNGNLMMTSNWNAGIKEGPAISYHTNGHIQAEEYFQNGQVHGILKYYDTLGRLRKTYTVVNGNRSGNSIEFYISGRIKESSNYEYDKLNGRRILYDTSGSVIQRLIYKEDSIIYAVSIYKDNSISNRLLPIYILPLISNSNKVGEIQQFEIGISDSFFEKSSVELIIGPLNEKLLLKDTIDVIKSDSLSIIYQYMPPKKGENVLSGIIREQAGLERKTENFQSFNYSFEVN